MKKRIVLGVCLILGFILFVRLNPPVETGTFAFNDNKTSILIGLGNKGFTDIQIDKVVVNENESPEDVKVQINSPEQGFVLTDDFLSSEATSYQFSNLEDTTLPRKTPIGDVYEKQDNQQVTESDRIYGLSILHDEPIFTTKIHYRYLGMPYVIEIELDNY